VVILTPSRLAASCLNRLECTLRIIQSDLIGQAEVGDKRRNLSTSYVAPVRTLRNVYCRRDASGDTYQNPRTRGAKHLVNAHFRILMLAAALSAPQIAFCQSAKSGPLDISGLWSCEVSPCEGSAVRFLKEGSGFKGVWVEPGAELTTTCGFKADDWAFSLTPAGPETLNGRIHLHYPVEMKATCPAQWDTEDEIDLTLKDGNTLEGRWHRYYMSSANCIPANPEWNSIVLVRRR
jgi:hypothetical protein